MIFTSTFSETEAQTCLDDTFRDGVNVKIQFIFCRGKKCYAVQNDRLLEEERRVSNYLRETADEVSLNKKNL
jgi:hypothetical protein